MELSDDILIALWFAFICGVLAYVVFRLKRSSQPEDLDPQSQRMSRMFGAPRLFDPLLARPMTSREKWGWVLFFVIAVAAIVFTGK